jgi:ABC-type phosphate transport system substrate-binding protein
MRKLTLLAGASALATISVASIAAAQVTQLYGGGATLAAPSTRQAGDCYGVQQTNAGLTPSVGYLVQNKNPTPPPPFFFTPSVITVSAFNYAGATAPQNCATTQITSSVEIPYISASSGIGIAALYTHDAARQWGPVDSAGDTWPYVTFGMSETSLGTTDVNVYDNGGVEQKITFTASPGAGQYPIPATLYGPLIQFPLFIDPVAIAYDATYKRVISADGSTHTDYHLNLSTNIKRTDGSGGLHLDAATYCAIFNGQVTNWNDAALQSLNSNTSLKDPADGGAFNVPLQIVGRSDSAGATSVFTRHLANVCASAAGNQYGNSTTTLPTALLGPAYNKLTAPYPSVAGETVGKYTLASGADGLAKYVGAFADNSTLGAGEGGLSANNGQTIVLGRIGYLGADYVLPAVLNTGDNSYGLNSASLKNSTGAFEPPTAKTALASFGTILPPQSTSKGVFCTTTAATCGAGLRSDPAAWVQAADKSVPLANPSAATGYPIVGTANILLYQCYATSPVTKALITKGSATVTPGFLYWYETSKTTTDAKLGLLAEDGLSILPTGWRAAIEDAFMTNKDKLGLQISTAQGATSTTAAACKVSGIVGG